MLRLGPSKLSLLSLLAFSAVPTFALNLLSGLPSCAATCPPITGSNTDCSIQADPLGCFCAANAAIIDQSTTYCATPDGCITPQDAQQLLKWYEGKCSGGTGTTTTSTSSVASRPDPTRNPSKPKHSGNTHTSPAATPSGSFVGSLPSNDESDGDWWPKHAKWVAMVIILIIGFSIIIAVGIFLKRRHDLKHNHAAQLPTGSGWAPNTSQFRNSQLSTDGYDNGHFEAQPNMKEHRFRS